jgi:glycerol uptake facilitator-like aquaporin
VAALARRALRGCEIVDALRLPQPLVSHHLAALRRAGLVQDRRDARRVYYSLVPAVFGADAAARALVSPLHAAAVEAFGTAVLALIVFAVTARRNSAAPAAHMAPFFIGFTVAVLISLFAPITQAGWNPARDLGPRLVALALGWGSVALPGPGGGFWVYIVGPLVGAPLGGLVWRVLGLEGEAELASEDGP